MVELKLEIPSVTKVAQEDGVQVAFEFEKHEWNMLSARIESKDAGGGGAWPPGRTRRQRGHLGRARTSRRLRPASAPMIVRTTLTVFFFIDVGALLIRRVRL